MRVAITVEGQRGLTWERWQRIAAAAEGLGFAGLYRSDHFLDADPPDQDSLELWTSLTWLASNTQRIEFGPLVTPLSFRHPVHTARMAKDVDALADGRLVLGVGAGWGGGQREHAMFGFDLLDVEARFARFEEGLQVISQLLRSEAPVTLKGHYFQLQDAALLPRPTQPGRPPIMVGGNGPNRILGLAARYADEWNAIYRTPAQFAVLNARLNDLLDAAGRPHNTVMRSQMKGVVFGKNQAELTARLAGRGLDDLLAGGLLAGTPTQIVDQLGELEAVGVQKVILQWADLDDMSGLETFAQTVLAQVQRPL